MLLIGMIKWVTIERRGKRERIRDKGEEGKEEKTLLE